MEWTLTPPVWCQLCRALAVPRTVAACGSHDLGTVVGRKYAEVIPKEA